MEAYENTGEYKSNIQENTEVCITHVQIMEEI